MARTQPLTQRLRRVPAFRNLSLEQLKLLAGAAERQNVGSGEMLYRQGEAASACFVVLLGTMRLTVRLGTKKTIAGLAFTNDLFGLESLRKRGKRPETAVAACFTELLEIDGSFMKRFLLDNPDFQLEFLDYAIAKLNETSTHAVQTGHYDAEQRIAAYLISRSGSKSSQVSKKTLLSQADVADYLALTPETFCRKVNKFRQLGWIEGSGNEYIIKKQDALRDLLDQ